MDTPSNSSPSCTESPDDINDGNWSDTGPAQLWNPHVGLKPSEEDGDASDGKVVIEDDLPYGATFEVNDNLIEMLIEMEDAHDLLWLPPKEQKQLEMRKKGEIIRKSNHASTYFEVQGRERPLRLAPMWLQSQNNPNGAPSTFMQQ